MASLALALAVLKDRHIQVALLHLSECIPSCVNTPDDHFLRILTGLLERNDRPDCHFIVIRGDGIDLRSANQPVVHEVDGLIDEESNFEQRRMTVGCCRQSLETSEAKIAR
jgi:hypothetical protein